MKINKKLFYEILYYPFEKKLCNAGFYNKLDLFKLRYFIKKIINFVTFEKNIRNGLYFDLSNEKIIFLDNGVEKDWVVVILSIFNNLIKNEEKIKIYINTFEEICCRCTKIYSCLLKNLEYGICVAKVPDFFYKEYIIGYDGSQKNLFEQNLINDIEEIKVFLAI
ncbi:hypothetical protein GVAV_000966 [Gurleya vavrai]